MTSTVQKPPIGRRIVNGYFNKIGRSYGQEMLTLVGIMALLLFIGWWFKI